MCCLLSTEPVSSRSRRKQLDWKLRYFHLVGSGMSLTSVLPSEATFLLQTIYVATACFSLKFASQLWPDTYMHFLKVSPSEKITNAEVRESSQGAATESLC